MSRQSWSRRRFLGAAGVGGMAAMGGLSGCVSSGGNGASSDGSHPSGSWIPRRGAFPHEGSINAKYLGLDDARTNESELSFEYEQYATGIVPVIDQLNSASLSDASGVTYVLPATVVHGSFDPSAMAEEMADTQFYERAGTYQEYELVTRSARIWALGSNAIVRGVPDRANAETVIDTFRGETDRAVSTDDDFSAMLDTLGNGTSIRVQSFDSPRDLSAPLPNETHAIGESLAVEGDRTSFTLVARLDSVPGDETVTTVRRALEDYRVDSVSVETDGREVTATTAFDTSELDRYLLGLPRRFTTTFPLPSDATRSGRDSGRNT